MLATCPNPPEPPPKDDEEKQNIMSNYNYWDAPPSKENGLTQLNKVMANFGGAAMATGPLKTQLTNAANVQFESSDLCRATITALYARKSLITAAENDNAIKTKLTKNPFLIDQNMREIFDGLHKDAWSRFKSPWRAQPTSINEGGANRAAFKQYLEAAIPPKYGYSGGPSGRDRPDPIVAELMQGVTFTYEGEKSKNNPWIRNGYSRERFMAFVNRLSAMLRNGAGITGDEVVIAGVHSSWIKDFVKEFANTGAKASYDQICKAIGIESKKKLGNGQMIDMKIELVNGEMKITEMVGYELQDATVPSGKGTVAADGTRKVNFGARFESFGDGYYADDRYYDDDDEDWDEEDAYYYDLLNYILSLIQ